MRHRDDIDGLRAVAVLPILLFHAGVSTLAGGFVGVDIFFVISGFLITSILLRDIDGNRFSLLEFYRRRAVRILPALIAVLLVVLALGALLLFASEYRDLGRSAAAAAGFVANLYFWDTADYFASAAETKPLLHSWSLGVEEQFYIFYPLLLILVRRFLPGRIREILIAMILGSFALALAAALKSPAFGFYMLPTRAWELGIGGLIAANGFPAVRAAGARSGLALLGLALILAGIVIIRADWMFPAPWALLPCLGAALLIAYGETAPTARLLTWGPMRWVGAVSYSLYLWHWPIISFYRIEYGLRLSWRDTVLLIVASLTAAALSYRFVEQPFQKRWRQGRPHKVVVVGAVAMTASVALAWVAADRLGGWRTLSPQAQAALAYAQYDKWPIAKAQFRRDTCFITSGTGKPLAVDPCLKRDANQPNALLFGDSHAAQYWLALARANPGVNLMQATASGCLPTLEAKGRDRCKAVVDAVLGDELDRGGFRTVVIAARWTQESLEPLLRTIALFKSKGVRVVVVGPVVEYEGTYPNLLARAMLQGDVEHAAFQRDDARGALDRLMAPRIRAAGADYYSVLDRECPNGRCLLFEPGGAPMHFDYGHVPLSASRYLLAGMPAL